MIKTVTKISFLLLFKTQFPSDMLGKEFSLSPGPQRVRHL